eukprot:42448_1
MAHAHRIHNNHGAIRVNGPIANNSAQHKRPSSKSIERLAQSITRSMYETVHKNRTIKYEAHDILQLLNAIPFKHDSIPNDMRFKWGEGIEAMQSVKTAVSDIGVRGSKVVMQNKQAIFASSMVLDDENNIMNRKQLNHEPAIKLVAQLNHI